MRSKPTERWTLRRMSGAQHTRHAETQRMPTGCTRREASGNASTLSKQYPRDVVLLVRGDRVMYAFTNGQYQRLTAQQSGEWAARQQ